VTERPRAAWHLADTYLRGSYGKLLLSLPLSIGQTVTLLPIAGIVRHAFDTAIPAGDVAGLSAAAAQIVGLCVANAIMTVLSRQIILTVTKRAVSDLRVDLLRDLYACSWPQIRELDTGQAHSVVVQDTERLDVMANSLFGVLLPELIVSLALCLILVVIDPLLFGALLAVLPLVIIPSRYLAWQAKVQTRAFHGAFEGLSTGVGFVLRAMELTRMQGSEAAELGRQKRTIDTLRGVSGRMASLFAAHIAVHRVALAASGALILMVGGRSVAVGALSLGQLLSFSVAAALLVNHLGAAMTALPFIIVGREALASIVRLRGALAHESREGTLRPSIRGEIRADAVWFQFGERPLLQGLDLRLAPGTLTALVGPNGAGKSTLLHLILGLYRPRTGRLSIDGHPYDELDLGHLRRVVGMVPQEPLIFAGTVLENITYGSSDLDRADAIRAAKRATADDFVAQLPLGYDTRIGHRDQGGQDGVRLSGGQRQRLAIARALVRRPPLLILDEPGNHLDRHTVRRLLDNIRSMDPCPTTLIVTHDAETAALCDAIVRLRDGRIVADADLWADGGAAPADARAGSIA
jgi:ABC-type multidrug transport system fused ATPase/permease subunit